MEIWYLISEEARDKIKKMMPKNWQPLRKPKLESEEEIKKIISEAPQYPPEYYR